MPPQGGGTGPGAKGTPPLGKPAQATPRGHGPRRSRASGERHTFVPSCAGLSLGGKVAGNRIVNATITALFVADRAQ